MPNDVEKRPAGINRSFWFSIPRGRRLARLEADQRQFLDRVETDLMQSEAMICVELSRGLYGESTA